MKPRVLRVRSLSCALQRFGAVQSRLAAFGGMACCIAVTACSGESGDTDMPSNEETEASPSTEEATTDGHLGDAGDAPDSSDMPQLDAAAGESPGDGSAAPSATSTDAGPPEGGGCTAEVLTVPNQGAEHVEEGSSIHYAHNPPASGPHYPVWASFQAYDVVVPRGYWVHNLEHGGIVFLIGPTASAELIQEVENFYAGLSEDPACGHSRALLTTDPLLDTALAVVAWDWVLQADCLDAQAITQFVLEHRAQGREDVCADGSFVP